MSDTLVNDIDPIETQDWLSAVDSLIRAEGAERAHYIINQVLSLIHISEPTRRTPISYAVFCLKKKKKKEGNI